MTCVASLMGEYRISQGFSQASALRSAVCTFSRACSNRPKHEERIAQAWAVLFSPFGRSKPARENILRLSSSRRGTEDLNRAQAGCCPGFNS
jgi:hypothetical protein